MVESGLSPNDLLENNGHPTSTADPDEAERWKSYALRLLSDVVRQDPSRLTEFDQRILRKYNVADMDRVASRRSVSSQGAEARCPSEVGLQISSPTTALVEKQTRVNFAQTRRRKIDRLKDFFQRRGKH